MCYAAIQLTVEAGRAGIAAVHIQARQLPPSARMAAVFDSILAVSVFDSVLAVSVFDSILAVSVSPCTIDSANRQMCLSGQS